MLFVACGRDGRRIMARAVACRERSVKKFSSVGRLAENVDKIEQSSRGIREGIANQAAMLNDKLEAIIAGINNEQRIINDKFSELIENFNSYHTDNNRHQTEIKEHLSTIAGTLSNITRDSNNSELALSLVNRQKILETKLDNVARVLLSLARPDRIQDVDLKPGQATRERPNAHEAWSSMPLLRAPKTYNTEHPDYDPGLVRNFPGVLLNGDKSSANPALRAVRQLIAAGEINDHAWSDQLEMALAELKSVPGSEQLFQRKAIAERFFLDINIRHEARYQPGWMNLDDGLFLYWLIRRLRPRIVVETGVANGFSTGLILLAMAKNGNDGRLYAIGRAETFDAGDPRWTEKGRVFSEVVVGGENLGWMAPEICRGAVELHAGDAKILLPEIIAKLDTIDLFFHDSDHSYGHMMFEFAEAKRKLSPTGVVVADNIAWNSSLWDFADDCGVPAYNFRGSVGAAFFG
jgi:predicted O-methyltransferase YrrM